MSIGLFKMLPTNYLFTDDIYLIYEETVFGIKLLRTVDMP